MAVKFEQVKIIVAFPGMTVTKGLAQKCLKKKKKRTRLLRFAAFLHLFFVTDFKDWPPASERLSLLTLITKYLYLYRQILSTVL